MQQQYYHVTAGRGHTGGASSTPYGVLLYHRGNHLTHHEYGHTQKHAVHHLHECIGPAIKCGCCPGSAQLACSAGGLTGQLPDCPSASVLLCAHITHHQPATLEAALSSVFPEANRIMQKQPGLDADLSGSTGIVAVSEAGVGNKGLCRAVQEGAGLCMLLPATAQGLCRAWGAALCFSCLCCPTGADQVAGAASILATIRISTVSTKWHVSITWFPAGAGTEQAGGWQPG